MVSVDFFPHQASTSVINLVLEPALNVSYRRYIVMLISCDFQNIVEISLSHIFSSISHNIFKPFLPIFTYFYLLKISIYGNTHL